MPHSNTVVHLVVKPKSVDIRYRKMHLIIKYAPADKRWHWEVEYHPPKRVFKGDNATQAIALAKAKKKVDWLIDGD